MAETLKADCAVVEALGVHLDHHPQAGLVPDDPFRRRGGLQSALETAVPEGAGSLCSVVESLRLRIKPL